MTCHCDLDTLGDKFTLYYSVPYGTAAAPLTPGRPPFFFRRQSGIFPNRLSTRSRSFPSSFSPDGFSRSLSLRRQLGERSGRRFDHNSGRERIGKVQGDFLDVIQAAQSSTYLKHWRNVYLVKLLDQGGAASSRFSFEPFGLSARFDRVETYPACPAHKIRSARKRKASKHATALTTARRCIFQIGSLCSPRGQSGPGQ